MLPIMRILGLFIMAYVFAIAAFLLTTAVKIPPNNMTAMACGCVGMFVVLVIAGKASE